MLVVRSKGEKDRVQPTKKTVLQAIETYLRHTGRTPGSDDGLLFRNCQSFETKGKYQGICTRNVNRILTDRLEAAGIVGKRLSPHSLRATAATKLLNTPGVTLPDVQGFLGHASITTTVRYTRLTTDLKKSAAARLKY